MAWEIKISDAALKDLQKLDRSVAKRIVTFIRERLGQTEEARALGKALKGAKLGNFFRYRVGDYRIICDIQDRKCVILVIKIGHRKEVYD